MMAKVRLTREERLFFTEQMSLLLAAGVSIVPALDLLIQSAKKRALRIFLGRLKKEVESGSSISSVLRVFQRSFSPLYVALIEVGEVSGKLPIIFNYLGLIERHRMMMLKSIRKALLYPCMVILVAIGVLLFILIAVVPTFEMLYQSGGVDLPDITKKVLSFSRFLLSSDGGWWIFYLVLSVWLIRSLFRRQGRCRYWFDRKVLGFPFIGAVFYANFNASFSQIMSIMMGAGIPLVRGVELYTAGISNLYIQGQLIRLRKLLEHGDSFYLASKDSGIFSNVALTLISVGEVSGTLVKVLERSGQYHAEIVAQRVDTFIALIDPLSLLFIGGIVGLILVALYLPMFNMGMAI